jgi:hypothetical protein
VPESPNIASNPRENRAGFLSEWPLKYLQIAGF